MHLHRHDQLVGVARQSGDALRPLPLRRSDRAGVRRRGACGAGGAFRRVSLPGRSRLVADEAGLYRRKYGRTDRRPSQQSERGFQPLRVPAHAQGRASLDDERGYVCELHHVSAITEAKLSPRSLPRKQHHKRQRRSLQRRHRRRRRAERQADSKTADRLTLRSRHRFLARPKASYKRPETRPRPISMCGIAGILTVESVDTAVLRRMIAPIAHRGPDDQGIWADPRAGIGLGHRRLSIVDLSPLGHQPMASTDERWVLSYNGEIYNHAALRTELEAAGWAGGWRGHSDTETLVECIAAWGLEKTLSQAVGMFALALWDRKDRTLHLARDRFGEKPLYY